MATTGEVEITIQDGGAAVSVPAATVQVVIGPSSTGTAAQPIATQNPNTLTDNFGVGELCEQGAMSAAAGGTIIAVKSATVTPGVIRGVDPVGFNIASSTNASPTVVTTSAPHLYVTGQVVLIAGHLVNTNANGTWKVTVLTATTFSLDGSVGNGVGAASGTVKAQGSNQVGTGTSKITFTGTPNDTYYIKILVSNSGTVGTTGIKFRVSLDAGRNYGPNVSLGTASTFLITNTGITLNFGTGNLVVNDVATCGCVGPASDTGSIITCLTSLLSSPYALAGWGSLKINSPLASAGVSAIQTYLNTMQTQYMFTRALFDARDASPPAIYGGTAESDTTWSGSIVTDYGSLDAKRACVNGGYYNMPSPFKHPVAGSPSYRRSLGWALAARQITIPPQRHAGRVRDGALGNIALSPTTDPTDGFVYHDERLNPSLDVSRFSSATSRIGKQGMYIKNPNLMSASGSVFTILPLGNVMDVACTIIHQVGQDVINSDIRLNLNGTIYELEALAIEASLYGQIFAQMISTSQISACTVRVDRTQNVLATSKVKVNVNILSRGYVLEEDVIVGFQNPFAGAA